MVQNSSNKAPDKKDENPAAIFSPKESLSIDAPIGTKQHANGDWHLIGESLPEAEKVSSLTGVASVGNSPIPAREDHTHAYADGTAAAPSIGWGNMGLYKVSPTVIGVAFGGINRWNWDTDRFSHVPNSFSIGLWTLNSNYSSVQGNQGYALFGNSVSDPAMYVRATTLLKLGGSGTDQVTLNSASMTVVPTINCNAISSTAHYATYLEINGTGGSSVHSNQQIQIRTGSGNTSGLSMWVQAAGIAPVLRCFSGNGESIDCGNNPGTGYAQFGANNFVSWSTIKIKKNVRRERKIRTDKVAALKGLRTATWDDKVPDMEIIPTARFEDLNTRWVESGKSPLTLIPEHTETRGHDCAVSTDCCGDGVEVFCGVHKRHHGRRGFIAEDVLEFLPEAVAMNNQNDVNGIDYSVIVAELWELVAHLNDRIEALESEKIK